jgi:hypothetical protein
VAGDHGGKKGDREELTPSFNTKTMGGRGEVVGVMQVQRDQED